MMQQPSLADKKQFGYSFLLRIFFYTHNKKIIFISKKIEKVS